MSACTATPTFDAALYYTNVGVGLSMISTQRTDHFGGLPARIDETIAMAVSESVVIIAPTLSDSQPA